MTKQTQKTVWQALAGVAIVVLLGCTAVKALDEAAKPAAGARVRIGVYDSRAVALCYYRSSTVSADRDRRYAELKKDMDKAQADKNEAKIKELKDKANAEQNRSHWQVFGNMPIDNIIEALKPELKQIARDSGVVMIVARPDFQSDQVELVDITERMVKGMNPGEDTRQMMQEMKKNEPVKFDWLKLDMEE